jgi:5-methyltetrahydropteroyltriglutamate--homocysteine methyltransferase
MQIRASSGAHGANGANGANGVSRPGGQDGLPLLPVSSIGSLPKPPALIEAEAAPLHAQDPASMQAVQEAAVADWLHVQEELGVDLPVDGEQYRRSMISYFLEGWGCAEVDPDPVWVLDNLYSQRAVVVGPARAPRDLLVPWYRFARRRAGRPLKVTVTGPYTLRDWAFDAHYANRVEAVFALAEYVREEVLALCAAGARYVQIDEPAFVTRYDQPAELDVAIAAMRRVVDGVPDGVTIFTHMCYGAFHEVYPKMLELPVHVLCLELSHVTPQLLDILRQHPFPAGRAMGFGVVDAMDPRVDTVEEIEARIRLALEYFRPEQLWLNPDCGMQAQPRAAAIGKLRNLVAAAQRVRAELQWRAAAPTTSSRRQVPSVAISPAAVPARP